MGVQSSVQTKLPLVMGSMQFGRIPFFETTTTVKGAGEQAALHRVLPLDEAE